MFKWTPEHVLNMPAMRFFALLESGRQIQDKKMAANAVMLCDVSSISLADGKYYDELRKFYLNKLVDPETTKAEAKKRAMDPTSETAKTLVSDLFDQAQRFT